MQTRALKSLVKISQVASFSEAAEQLGMTLSALSMQMKALEDFLGVELFDRSVRPPRLTPVARYVVEESRSLLRHEQQLMEICHPSEDLAGRYRLGFVTTAAVRLLPAFLLAAKEAAPRATFEFETGLSATLQTRVVSGRLDAAVITDADGLPDQLTSVGLREEPFVFAAHQRLLSDGLPGLLSHHAFFHFMPDTGIGKLIADAMTWNNRPEGAKTIVLDNLEAIMECVAAGLGFTLLPLPDVERYCTPEIKKIAAPGTHQRKLVLISARTGGLAERKTALAALFGK